MKIYIDYDADPEIGGQQGVYFLDDDENKLYIQDIIGCKIVAFQFPDEELDALGHSGRVLVLTLEKAK